MADKKRSGRFRKKSEGPGMLIMILTGVVLGAVIGGVIFAAWYSQAVLDKIPRVEYTAPAAIQEQPLPTVKETAAAEVLTEPFQSSEDPQFLVPEDTVPRSDDDVINVMVIGQSARPGELYHMADSMILVTINKISKTMTLTSFLRDAFMKMPDYRDLSGRLHAGGYDRLNTCYHMGYSFGGTADAMQMLNQCLYENFGVDVDFNIEVGFDGVIQMVDYCGGIPVELTEAEAEYLNADDLYVRQDVQPGYTVLDGMATLSYVRMRNAEGDAGSDIRRTARQRVVLEKLMDLVRTMNVKDLTNLMDTFLPYVVTDMTDEDITGCILEVFPIVGQLRIETGTCPAQDTYWAEIVNIGGYEGTVLRYDEEQNRTLMQALTEGNS